ncbi:MAG: hypothetical protein IJL87_02725 [Clostridia bacterium]|nr:hypothetical protein [Clostridia bacterium]
MNKKRFLISGVCFAVAAVCALAGILMSKTDIQLALSCFSCTLLTGLSVTQLVRALKK